MHYILSIHFGIFFKITFGGYIYQAKAVCKVQEWLLFLASCLSYLPGLILRCKLHNFHILDYLSCQDVVSCARMATLLYFILKLPPLNQC